MFARFIRICWRIISTRLTNNSTVMKLPNAHRWAIVHHRPVIVSNPHCDAFSRRFYFELGIHPWVDSILEGDLHELVTVYAHVLVPEANRVADLMYTQAELRQSTHIRNVVL